MKIKLFITAIAMTLSCLSAQAKGGIPIFYSDGEDIVKVYDLPMREEFMIQAENGQWYHADLGIRHEQFGTLANVRGEA